jgi:multiple sugar transport system substrate-binding protein
MALPGSGSAGRLTRRAFAGAGVAAAAPVLAACGAGGGEPRPAATDLEQEFDYWHGWTSAQMVAPPDGTIPKIIAWFRQRYPNVTVNALTVPWGDMPAKLTAAAAGGTPPGVVMCANGGGVVYQFAHSNLIQPLEKVAAAADLRRLKEWITPAIWDLGVYNGKLYGIAQWTQSYGVYYNKGHFREVGLDPNRGPQTLDELATYAERLTKRDPGAPGGYARLGFFGDWFRPWVPSFGGQYVDAAGRKITANSPQMLRMLEWFSDWFRRYDVGRINAFRASFTGIPGGGFPHGKFSMVYDGPWLTRTTKLNNPGTEYGVVYMPSAPDQSGLGCFTYGDIPVVPTGLKQPDGPWQYVQFLTGIVDPTVVPEMHLYQPQTPTSEKSFRAGDFKQLSQEYPDYDLFARALFEAKRFVYPPKIPSAAEYGRILDKYVADARDLAITPREALDRATQESQVYLDQALAQK